jgi:dihydroorotase (multifunctional complex type)
LIVDTVFTDAKAYVDNRVVDCCIAIDNGKIFRIGKESNMPKAERKIALKYHLVLPGLIDAHVHLRDERNAYKEDFYSGTAAAVAGGFTTVLDMPNNDPVTMSAEALRNRMKIAESRILTNVGFFSEFPRDLEKIERIVGEGAVAFKLYMAEQIGGLDISEDDAVFTAFRILSTMGVPVVAHAEDRGMLEMAKRRLMSAGRNDADAFVEAHSESVEARAVERLLGISKRAGNRVHFCHISSRKGLDMICAAKNSGMSVTCETTPHNLLLSVDDLVKVGSAALTMPPVRNKKHIEALWAGVKNGSIDILASDHAPHVLAEKNTRNMWEAKTGIPGLETTLPLLLTEVKRGRLSIAELVRLLAERPAEIFGLKGRGRIEEGNAADLTVVDLDIGYEIDASEFRSKAKFSPFDGWKVVGKAVKTIVCGQLVMDEGQIVANAGSGRIIRRA